MKRFSFSLRTLGWTLALGFLCLGFGALQACQKEPFDKQALLIDLAQNVVIPSYEALQSETKTLRKIAGEFCTAPSTEKLQTLQKQWKRTKLSWKRCQIFRFGPAEEFEAHSHIDYWPSKTHLIEKEIKGTSALTPAYVRQLGASRRGLPAIEYLIFPQDKQTPDALVKSLTATDKPSRRCQYIEMLTQGIETTSTQIVEAWKKTPTEKRAPLFVAPINKDKLTLSLQPAIDEMINEWVFLVERMADTKLGVPLGSKNGGTIQPQKLEAFRSLHSLEAIKANLESIESLYYGRFGTKKGLGIRDLLLHYGTLVDKHLVRDIKNAKDALNALKSPLHSLLTKDVKQVDYTQKVVKVLHTTVNVEVVGNLGVTLTFSDNDGD